MRSGSARAHRRNALAGTLFCFSAAVLFSAKSILIKLAYVQPVDAYRAGPADGVFAAILSCRRR